MADSLLGQDFHQRPQSIWGKDAKTSHQRKRNHLASPPIGGSGPIQTEIDDSDASIVSIGQK